MKIILAILLSGCIYPVFGQDAYSSYRLADSLYRVQDYKASARATMVGLNADKIKDNPTRSLHAAGSFARAGIPDSAFAVLSKLSASNRISPAAVKGMATNKDLAVLQTDARWKPLFDKLTKKAAGNYKVEEIIYGHKDGLAMSMLQLSPKGKPNGRAIIRVVAGSWYSSISSAESYVTGSYDYLQKGFRVYHVMVGSNPRYNIEEQIGDVKRAIRFIRYNAERFGVSPNHIGLEGGSAGGHLTLAVGTANDLVDSTAADPVDRVSSRVQSMAVQYPPTDILNWGGKGLNMVSARQMLEYNKVWGAFDFHTLNVNNMTLVPVTDTAERNKIGMAVSPVYSVTPDDPPVFIIHGDADATVPLQQSLIFVERLKAAGINYKFVVKPGAGHNYLEMLPEWLDAATWFLETLL